MNQSLIIGNFELKAITLLDSGAGQNCI